MLLFETLERRTHLTVTVNQGYPGYYEITGDSADNEITVSVSQNNYTFVLNNITYFDVMFIAIDGGGGHDTINVTSFDGPGYIATSVQGGVGNDIIGLGIPGGIWGGDGDDLITLTDSYRGETYGEDGNDTIYINGECVDAEIRGGSGDDFIDCSNSAISVIMYGGSGNDTLIGSGFDDLIYGDEGADLLVGGGGNDTFYTDDYDTISESFSAESSGPSEDDSGEESGFDSGTSDGGLSGDSSTDTSDSGTAADTGSGTESSPATGSETTDTTGDELLGGDTLVDAFGPQGQGKGLLKGLIA